MADNVAFLLTALMKRKIKIMALIFNMQKNQRNIGSGSPNIKIRFLLLKWEAFIWHENKTHNEHKKPTNLVIDPILAFGSRHHETTSSCIKLIEKYVQAQA